MRNELVAQLTEVEIEEGFIEASKTQRRRSPKILHKPGDEFNRVINFILNDSYMQPHLHPGPEKIEVIKVIRGSLEVIFFDDFGAINKRIPLEEGGFDSIQIPAFQWHTYLMLSNRVITYETMMGVYDPNTWKKMASWAPREGLNSSIVYLNSLR